jgi:DNA-binding CsgD family transcriptional regulator
MSQKILDDIFINKIRNEIKNGKNKIQIAIEYGISYYTAKKHTQDIPTILNISKQLQQKIREEIKKGKSIRQVAKELQVSRDTVIKYTRDIPKHWKKPGRTKEEIKQIRKNVIKYNSRFKTSKIMNIPYSSVYGYTWDIKLKRGLSEEEIRKIREETLNGKTKTLIARENNVSYKMVLKHTGDIPSCFHLGGWRGIRGKSLEILQVLITAGYYICSKGDSEKYRLLKKYFPTICKVNIYGKNILFLEDKSNIAIRGFLESINKRKISCWELEKISKAFKSKLGKHEKLKFVCRS